MKIWLRVMICTLVLNVLALGAMPVSAGDNAAKYASSEMAEDIETASVDIEARKRLLDEIKTRKEGAKWQEALTALQQIMVDHCGDVRSDVLLQTGLEIIGRLKIKARSSLIARNPHELMNCIQVMNLIEIGELVFISAYDRRETRALHRRPEYTFSDPLLGDKLHLIKQVNGAPATE